MGPVHGFMAPGAPAVAPGDIVGVIASPDFQPSLDRLLLKMALEAEDMIGRLQHLGVDRPVLRMAGHTPFPNRLVFKDKWAPLGGMALQAGAVCSHQLQAVCSDRPGSVGGIQAAAV